VYEHRTHPIASRRHFARRVLWHLAGALSLIGLSLLVGILGYERFEHLAFLDAFLNAAMLLGGMGPVDTRLSDPGKVFAGLYALYAGLVLIVAAGVLVAPVVHRVLHSFHWDLDNGPDGSRGRRGRVA